MNKITALFATLFICGQALATGSHHNPPPPPPPPAPKPSTQTQGQQQNQTQNQNTSVSIKGGSTSASGGNASSTSDQTNTQSILFTAPAHTTSSIQTSGTTTVRNVPSVNGPALTSSNDTCMGSVSGSINVAGFGGGLGSTYVDEGCVLLKQSREVWNMGFRAAALARMCMDDKLRMSLEVTGFECPDFDSYKQLRADGQSGVVKPHTIDLPINDAKPVRQ